VIRPFKDVAKAIALEGHKNTITIDRR